jgi:hypothetical protein
MVPRKSSNNLYGVATNRVRVALVMIHLPHVLMWNNSSRILVRLTDSHSYLNFRFSMSILVRLTDSHSYLNFRFNMSIIYL